MMSGSSNFPLYPMIDILEASFCAYRINDNKILREPVYDMESVDEPIQIKMTNYQLIINHFDKKSLLKITNEDREHAKQSMQVIDHDRTLKLLRGESTTEFVDNIIKEGKEKESKRVKLLLWVPEIYFRVIEKQQFDEAVITSKHIGNIGDKMTVNVEVINKKYIPRLSCWIVTSKNKDNDIIQWFTAKDEYTVSGKYYGIINKLEENPYLRGSKTTMMNRVKLLDK